MTLWRRFWHGLPGTATPAWRMYRMARRQNPWMRATQAQQASAFAAHASTMQGLRTAHARQKFWPRFIDWCERRSREFRAVQWIVYPIVFIIAVRKPAFFDWLIWGPWRAVNWICEGLSKAGF